MNAKEEQWHCKMAEMGEYKWKKEHGLLQSVVFTRFVFKEEIIEEDITRRRME